MAVEYVQIVPDTRMMNISGMSGYSFSDIISEYIDNSIDGRSEREMLDIDIIVEPDLVRVIDNAKGMNKSELQDALTLAKRKKEEGKLGLYGIGLKTSSVALGRYFEVISLKEGEQYAYRSWWDEYEWDKRDKWEIPLEKLSEKPKELENNKHGTIVEITQLKMKVGNKINQLRGDIGRRFSPFINRNIARISVNNQLCKAIQPGIMENTKKEIFINAPSGRITGWVALLKNSSQKGCYGFDTFRGNRMITYYDKIGFSPHPTVARVVGELHMDHVPVTTNKREWIKTSHEYDEAESLIAEEIKEIVKESRRLASEKHIKAVEKNRIEYFKEGLAEAIRSDELKEYTSPEREVSSAKSTDGTKGENTENIKNTVEIERRIKSSNPKKGTIEPKHTGRKRIPKRTHLVTKNKIVVKGKTFDYEHKWGHLGEEGPIKDYSFDSQSKKLDIITNIDFPAIHVTTDRAFYAFSQIVECVAMVMVEEANADYSKYEDIRQVLMRKSSRYVAELKD